MAPSVADVAGTGPVAEPARAVPGLYRLSGPIKHYDWGSFDALPRLLGRPVDGRRHAEMWVGAHPAEPSVATDPLGRHVPLDELLEAQPHLLGGGSRDAPGASRLPFLVKVLAAERPLSLQVHPDAARAARGFAAGKRGYRDPWHKPEMIYALRPFEALCGFTSPARAAARLRALAVPGLAGVIDDLADSDGSRALHSALARLLTLEAAPAARLVRDVAVAARSSTDPAHRFAVRLARFHPTDPAVIASMLLNPVTLQPGEALFVPPNTLHTYLRGVGVEVMATSDNVLRAGLTGKPVDVVEVLETAEYAPGPPRVVPPERVRDDERGFAPGVSEFRMSVVRCATRTDRAWHDGRARTVLCLDGGFSLRMGGAELALARGEPAFVAAGPGPVDVVGAGVLISVTSP